MRNHKAVSLCKLAKKCGGGFTDFNPIALRMTKTRSSFGGSECNRVKKRVYASRNILGFYRR